VIRANERVRAGFRERILPRLSAVDIPGFQAIARDIVPDLVIVRKYYGVTDVNRHRRRFVRGIEHVNSHGLSAGGARTAYTKRECGNCRWKIPDHHVKIGAKYEEIMNLSAT
jgi:hypothetical protein